MTLNTLRIFAYTTSIVLLIAGEIALWFLFRESDLRLYLMAGYPLLVFFFLGMKLMLVKTLGRHAPPASSSTPSTDE